GNSSSKVTNPTGSNNKARRGRRWGRMAADEGGRCLGGKKARGSGRARRYYRSHPTTRLSRGVHADLNRDHWASYASTAVGQRFCYVPPLANLRRTLSVILVTFPASSPENSSVCAFAYCGASVFVI